MSVYKSSSDTKRFIYYVPEDGNSQQQKEGDEMGTEQKKIPNHVLDRLLSAIGREVLKEKTPTLEELEQTLEDVLDNSKHNQSHEYWKKQEQNKTDFKKSKEVRSFGIPIITQLIQGGYLVDSIDSRKWLSTKGFVSIGGKMLNDIMKALKTGDLGLHQTTNLGMGSLIMDTTKKYEYGDDIRLINVPVSLLNTIQRIARSDSRRDHLGIKVPLDISIEDLEEYETTQDIRLSIVYCIDLSSTMRYSSMFGDMSRIEAAKRALWSLFLLNRKFFTTDSVYIIGFGALASKVAPQDIPYLKTFEPGSDFLHYTNYQAAFRLARKILQKDGAKTRRIVLVTDGHPSACFIDDKKEQNEILSQRPYSHFYMPDQETLNAVKMHHDMSLDTASGDLIYLCYRYKHVDQYIGEKTIMEAKKCHNIGIEIDTIMISEENSLLEYVNEMEKAVKGRSYYMNPEVFDRALLTDYLYKKKQIIKGHS
jgi:uncharacterized protein with von Willebrand factor type A (vWA) domain